jgi:hypothetical protein
VLYSVTMKLPDWPKLAHEYHHDKCQLLGVVNGGVFSSPLPLYVAMMTGFGAGSGFAGAGLGVELGVLTTAGDVLALICAGGLLLVAQPASSSAAQAAMTSLMALVWGSGL